MKHICRNCGDEYETDLGWCDSCRGLRIFQSGLFSEEHEPEDEIMTHCLCKHPKDEYGRLVRGSSA